MSEYIERKEALDIVKRTSGDYAAAFAEIARYPAANVVHVVHAEWEECDYVEPCIHGFGTIRHKNDGLKCTNCVHVFKKELLWKENFCPNCGAKMDVENHE